MANADAPYGLRPRYGNAKTNQYSAGTTTDIFKGDVVSIDTNGHVATILTTTGSATVLGVAANFVDASASSSAQNVWVYDNPHEEFVLQDDGASGTPALDSTGATAPLVITTGNTTSGQSKHELDISGLGTAATDPLVILGFITGPGRVIGKNADIVVKLNRHIRAMGSSGI